MKSDSFFLFGARGTGKTTLLKADFAAASTLWINLLDPVEEDLFVRNPGELVSRIAAIPALCEQRVFYLQRVFFAALDKPNILAPAVEAECKS